MILTEDDIRVQTTNKVHLDTWLRRDEWEELLANQAKVKELEVILGKTLADLHISNEQIIGLEATLDDIKDLTINPDYHNISPLELLYRIKALAKHEGNKFEKITETAHGMKNGTIPTARTYNSIDEFIKAKHGGKKDE